MNSPNCPSVETRIQKPRMVATFGPTGLTTEVKFVEMRYESIATLATLLSRSLSS